uniref:Uncharacterized protein n=1 Tax=Oryza glaberrima TaxID=4538 RepID=I1NZP2_ORYGL
CHHLSLFPLPSSLSLTFLFSEGRPAGGDWGGRRGEAGEEVPQSPTGHAAAATRDKGRAAAAVPTGPHRARTRRAAPTRVELGPASPCRRRRSEPRAPAHGEEELALPRVPHPQRLERRGRALAAAAVDRDERLDAGNGLGREPERPVQERLGAVLRRRAAVIAAVDLRELVVRESDLRRAAHPSHELTNCMAPTPSNMQWLMARPSTNPPHLNLVK